MTHSTIPSSLHLPGRSRRNRTLVAKSKWKPQADPQALLVTSPSGENEPKMPWYSLQAPELTKLYSFAMGESHQHLSYPAQRFQDSVAKSPPEANLPEQTYVSKNEDPSVLLPSLLLEPFEGCWSSPPSTDTCGDLLAQDGSGMGLRL